MASFMQPDEQTTRLTTIPSDLPILPLRNTLAYPFSVMPLAIGIPRSIRLIEDALQGSRLIGLVGMPDGQVEEPMVPECVVPHKGHRLFRHDCGDRGIGIIHVLGSRMSRSGAGIRTLVRPVDEKIKATDAHGWTQIKTK